jgi:hypothetical protein
VRRFILLSGVTVKHVHGPTPHADLVRPAGVARDAALVVLRADQADGPCPALRPASGGEQRIGRGEAARRRGSGDRRARGDRPTRSDDLHDHRCRPDGPGCVADHAGPYDDPRGRGAGQDPLRRPHPAVGPAPPHRAIRGGGPAHPDRLDRDRPGLPRGPRTVPGATARQHAVLGVRRALYADAGGVGALGDRVRAWLAGSGGTGGRCRQAGAGLGAPVRPSLGSLTASRSTRAAFSVTSSRSTSVGTT